MSKTSFVFLLLEKVGGSKMIKSYNLSLLIFPDFTPTAFSCKKRMQSARVKAYLFLSVKPLSFMFSLAHSR